MKTYLTYDDVNIVPKYSELESREDVKLNTRFTKNTELTIPIVASPMDTVTEEDMAEELLDWGGVGVIHRFNTIEEAVEDYNLAKYQVAGVIPALDGDGVPYIERIETRTSKPFYAE